MWRAHKETCKQARPYSSEGLVAGLGQRGGRFDLVLDLQYPKSPNTCEVGYRVMAAIRFIQSARNSNPLPRHPGSWA